MKLEGVTLLVRVALLLAFAAGWAGGSWALGYLLLADRTDVALGVAFAGGVVAGLGLGALTERALPILLGVPLAIVAVTAPVYLAGIAHLETRPRLRVVAGPLTCAGDGCERAVADPSGGHIGYTIGEDVHEGAVLDVYVVSGRTVAVWPEEVVAPRAQVRAVAAVGVPAFVGYVAVLGVAGAFGQAAQRRRFKRHMLT